MKRAVSLCLALLLLLTPALSIAVTWQEMISEMNDSEVLMLWEVVQKEVQRRRLDTQPATEQMVWVPRSGSKYHKKSTCSNMKNPLEVPLSYAISCGFEPCKKCKP